MPRPPTQKGAPTGITIGANEQSHALVHALDAVLA